MDKKSNMKKAMYEMFGVGGDGSEAASTAPAQVKSASVEVKSAPGAEKKSVSFHKKYLLPVKSFAYYNR